MTILRDVSESNEWYFRKEAVCSPALLSEDRPDGGSLFEFCVWLEHPGLFSCLRGLDCIVAQSAYLDGGWVTGVHYNFCAHLVVKGADAWDQITAIFDEQILDLVWGDAIEALPIGEDYRR